MKTLHELFVLSQCARGKVTAKLGKKNLLWTNSYQNLVRELYFADYVYLDNKSHVRATSKGLEALDIWCGRIWPEARDAVAIYDTQKEGVVILGELPEATLNEFRKRHIIAYEVTTADDVVYPKDHKDTEPNINDFMKHLGHD